ncbi:MAG: LytTR family DNA-binding domain-containing protein [Acutalibacter sp.]
MEKLKELLPQDGRFSQCHRGIVVNLNWVASLEKEVAVMKNGDVLPVSRRNYHAFVAAQNDWNFRKLREKFCVLAHCPEPLWSWFFHTVWKACGFPDIPLLFDKAKRKTGR